MSNQDNLTFIEKIEKQRTFAHRMSSDSDSGETTEKSESPDTSHNNKKPDDCTREQGQDTECCDHDEDKSSQVVGSDETNTSGRQPSLPKTRDAGEEGTIGWCQTLLSEQLPSVAEEREVTRIDVKRTLGNNQSKSEANWQKISKDVNDRKMFYLNDETNKLVAFNSFEELSQFLLDRKTDGKKLKSPISSDVMGTILGVSVKSIVSHVTIGEFLHQLYLTDELTDVEIDVRGEQLLAHRVVLCCYSKYFNNLFLECKSSKLPFNLKVKGVSPHAFAAFIEFCYTGELNVYPEIAADLLIVADHLQVRALKKNCSMITTNLPLDQAVKLIVNSSGSSTHMLYRSLAERISENFSAATKLDDLLEMNEDRLCELLVSDDLVVQSELEIFQFAIRWIVHNIEDRVKYTMKLLKLVRFCHMTTDEIHTCAETSSLIRGYDKFREAILIAYWQKSSSRKGRIDPFGFPTLGRRTCFLKTELNETPAMPTPVMTSKPVRKQDPYTDAHVKTMTRYVPIVDFLLFAGHEATSPGKRKVWDYVQKALTLENGHGFVERYDTRDNQWAHFCKLPVARRHHAVTALKGRVYIVGGSEVPKGTDDPVTTDTLFVLDINSKTWMRKASMLTARRQHCVCTAIGKLYAIGGKDNTDCVLKTVECYDPAKDTWTHVSPMNSPRCCASAARYAGSIVVAGGMGEDGGSTSVLPVLNTVESYDVENDKWSRRNNLRYPRCNANLVSLKDRLFLCGGATPSGNFRSTALVSQAAIDEYDDEDDVWSHVADMFIPRHEAAAASAGDKLYIMGGVSTVADRVLQSVECFDCQKMQWVSGLQDLPQAADSVSCATIASKWQKAYQDELTSL